MFLGHFIIICPTDFLENSRHSTEPTISRLQGSNLVIMKVTSILSACTLALATVVSANHGQHDDVPAHTEALASKPTHHWAVREADAHETYEHMKPSDTRHFARDFKKPEWEKAGDKETDAHKHQSRDAPHHDSKPSEPKHHWVRDMHKPSTKPEDAAEPKHHWARGTFKPSTKPEDAAKPEAAAEPKHHWARAMSKPAKPEDAGKPEAAAEPKHHWARAMFKPSTKPEDAAKPADAAEPKHHWARGMFKSSAKPEDASEPKQPSGDVAGKPGHHFTARRTGGNPYAGIRFTSGTAITSVRGILTGSTGIRKTCDRCVTAMQVGQSLAQQSDTNDFSNAVVGLCKQVGYKSDSACESSFAPSQVGPYMSTLQNANIQSNGKSFCRSYFNTC